MPEKIVSVPTVKGIGAAFKDFGIGALGGLVFILALKIFGPLGILAAPLLTGSTLKGDKGTLIATVAGFMLVAGTGVMAGGTAAASSDAGDM
jgi:hypothetical protein